MSDVKWTKGNWEVRIEQIVPSSNETTFTVATEEYDIVSPMLGIRKEEDADLMAAAPELYNKLEMLHSYLLEDDPDYAESQEFNEVESLMAKARGES